MQHVEGSGTPVLYIGRTVLKGKIVRPFFCGVTVRICYETKCQLTMNQISAYLTLSKSKNARKINRIYVSNNTGTRTFFEHHFYFSFAFAVYNFVFILCFSNFFC